MIIETPRLILREHTLDDAASVFELNQDFEVVKFTGDHAFNSLQEAKDLIQNNIQQQYIKYGYGRWVVIQKSDQQFLGWCGLKYLTDIAETDLGYRLKQSAWKKGYATEAALACINFAWSKNIARLIGRAAKENHASINVLEKCGFKHDHDELLHGQQGVVYYLNKI